MELPQNLTLKIHEQPSLQDQKALVAVAVFLGKLERTYRIHIPLFIEMPNLQWPRETKKKPAFPELAEARNGISPYWKGLRIIKKQLKEWLDSAAERQPK